MTETEEGEGTFTSIQQHVGRPCTKQTLVSRAKILRESGRSIREVARELRISPATVQKYCRAA